MLRKKTKRPHQKLAGGALATEELKENSFLDGPVAYKDSEFSKLKFKQKIGAKRVPESTIPYDFQ